MKIYEWYANELYTFSVICKASYTSYINNILTKITNNNTKQTNEIKMKIERV